MTKRKTGNASSTTTASKSRSSGTTKKATKQAAPKTAPKTKTTKPPAKAKKSSPIISAEQRVLMISEAAYYNALNSDNNGQDMLHWLKAETDINSKYHVS